jgi:hypothetical protein
MSHMQKFVTEKMLGWRVETHQGTQFVPGDVVDVPDWLRLEHPILDTDASFDAGTFEMFRASLQSYVEGTIISIAAIHGYFGRWSAPGYMDCTEWTFGRSLRDIREQLAAYDD